MWAEFSERYLWRNPRAQVTQVVPPGLHLVKRELGLAAIAEGKAKEAAPPKRIEKGEGE